MLYVAVAVSIPTTSPSASTSGPSGVTGDQLCIRLDESVEVLHTGSIHFALFGGGLLERSHRPPHVTGCSPRTVGIADSDDALSESERGRVAQRCRCKPAGPVELQNRHVRSRVGTDDNRAIGLSVAHVGRHHLGGIAYHVVVGEDLTQGRQYDASPEPLAASRKCGFDFHDGRVDGLGNDTRVPRCSIGDTVDLLR